jgi:hypothetical protein
MTAAARRLSPSTSWAPRAHGRGRGDDGEAVREHREAQDVADTLVLRCLAKTPR